MTYEQQITVEFEQEIGELNLKLCERDAEIDRLRTALAEREAECARLRAVAQADTARLDWLEHAVPSGVFRDVLNAMPNASQWRGSVRSIIDTAARIAAVSDPAGTAPPTGGAE